MTVDRSQFEPVYSPAEPLTREQAVSRYLAAQRMTPDFSRTPLEAGMRGCPWRTALAIYCYREYTGSAVVCERRRKLLIRTNAQALDRYGRAGMGALLQAFPNATGVVTAGEMEVRRVLEDAGVVDKPNRRARAIYNFSRGWLEEEWRNILDLPYMGLRVYDAIMAHCLKPQ